MSMFTEFVEEYKGVKIHVWLQTHRESVSEFLGHGHNMVKNPAYKGPAKPLARPVFHAVSHELSAVEATSFSKEKAVLAYKGEIDRIQEGAKWKKAHGYSDNLFKSSEKFLLTV